MNPIAEIPSFYDLSDLAIASVGGQDACRFLQGQLSNDINLLNEDSPHQLSAYCSPKGRILALFHVFMLDGVYLLVAPRAIMIKVIPRLKMFVMRSAVEITLLEEATLLGLYAPGGLKTEMFEAIPDKGAQIAGHCNDKSRFFLLGSETFEHELKPGNEWRRLDIEQNLPQIYIENYEALIPQSVNLDLVGGVNFKKGCYPGQEIIARVKYRGKPKTRMIGVKASATEPVTIGDSVFVDGRENAAGQVINTAKAGEDTLLSISIPVTHSAEGAIFLDQTRTNPCERLKNPFQFTA